MHADAGGVEIAAGIEFFAAPGCHTPDSNHAAQCCSFVVQRVRSGGLCSADRAMQDVFGAKYVSLHVRVTNKGAHHLYTQSLGYKCAFLPTNTTHTK